MKVYLKQHKTDMDKITRIRQEIGRLKSLLNDSNYYLDNSEQAVGYENALDDLNEFIGDLSEEPGVDVTDFCKPVDPSIAQCVADHWWEILDGKEPDKSLEEAAEEYRRESFKNSVIPQIDGPVSMYGGSIKGAFIAGAEWQKEHMMKDAVEGKVFMSFAPGHN